MRRTFSAAVLATNKGVKLNFEKFTKISAISRTNPPLMHPFKLALIFEFPPHKHRFYTPNRAVSFFQMYLLPK